MNSPMAEATSGAKLGPLSATKPDVPQKGLASLNVELNVSAAAGDQCQQLRKVIVLQSMHFIDALASEKRLYLIFGHKRNCRGFQSERTPRMGRWNKYVYAKRRLNLIDRPHWPSDQFLRLHFRRCLAIIIDYKDQEIENFSGYTITKWRMLAIQCGRSVFSLRNTPMKVCHSLLVAKSYKPKQLRNRKRGQLDYFLSYPDPPLLCQRFDCTKIKMRDEDA